MVYFTSDTHFGHSNIIEFCRRPFSTVEEMNETLIENWNARVKNNDSVYILGDMFFHCEPETVEDILKRLHGRKYLIVGNHDSSWMTKVDYKAYFEDVSMMLDGSFDSRGAVLCHYPLMSWKHQKKFYMLHGHIHNETNLDYWPLIRDRKLMLNVGTDVNGFQPVTFDELIANNRAFKEKNR